MRLLEVEITVKEGAPNADDPHYGTPRQTRSPPGTPQQAQSSGAAANRVATPKLYPRRHPIRRCANVVLHRLIYWTT